MKNFSLWSKTLQNDFRYWQIVYDLRNFLQNTQEGHQILRVCDLIVRCIVTKIVNYIRQFFNDPNFLSWCLNIHRPTDFGP